MAEIQFPDPDKRSKRKTLFKEIQQVLMLLHDATTSNDEKLVILQYADCITPSSNYEPGFDDSRLPVNSQDGKAQHASRFKCLCALISATLYNYWELVNVGTPTAEMRLHMRLAKLRKVLTARTRVEGDVKNGFELRV